MSTPTLFARAQALLRRRAAQTAAVAIVPLALAAQTARAQVVLTSIEAGFIDASGSRFAFGSAPNAAGFFTSSSLFNFSSATSATGFTLAGDLHFDATQHPDGAGEDPGIRQRYLSLTGTWDNSYTGHQPLQITLSGSSTFTGSMPYIMLNYADQSTGSGGYVSDASSGGNYQITFDDTSLSTGARGSFTLDLTYIWAPSPADASSLLVDTFTLSAATTAIPEPSTYAALLGAAALAVVIAVRRSRRVVV